MTAEAYEELVRGKVRPMYEELKRRGVKENILAPKVAYGWFRAFAEGDTLVVEHDGRSWPFPSPGRRTRRTCASRTTSGRGKRGGRRRLLRGDHRGGDGAGDAGAVHLRSVPRLPDAPRLRGRGHRRAGGVLARGDAPRTGDRGGPPGLLSGYVVQEYQGSRYGFGYPSCPDLSAHVAVFELLDPGRIGVTLTESMEMVPEQTTSAIVVHHPQAKYFAV